MGGDRGLHGKPPLACGACPAADGGPPAAMAWAVLRDRRARMCGAGGLGVVLG